MVTPAIFPWESKGTTWVLTDTTIGMVVVEEENGIEHRIYYLIQNINETESKYSYVEKLALAVIQAVQRF